MVPTKILEISAALPRVAEEWALEMKAEEESYNCFHSKAESSKGKPRQAIYEVCTPKRLFVNIVQQGSDDDKFF